MDYLKEYLNGVYNTAIFRGKSVETKQWVIGYFKKESDEEYILPATKANWIKIETGSLGQYIGKKDINNVPMFSGDIVELYLKSEKAKIKNRSIGTGLVMNGHYYCNNKAILADTKDTEDTSALFLSLHGGVVVIGNIYDNPEMLENLIVGKETNDTNQ